MTEQETQMIRLFVSLSEMIPLAMVGAGAKLLHGNTRDHGSDNAAIERAMKLIRGAKL